MRLARHRWSLLIAVCLLVDAYIVWFQPQHTSSTSARQQQALQPQQQALQLSQPQLTPQQVDEGHTPTSPPAGLATALPAQARRDDSAGTVASFVTSTDAANATTAVATSTPAVSAAALSTAAASTPSLAALEFAAAQLNVRCRLLVATAVFEGSHLLRQPQYCRSDAAHDRHRRTQRSASTSGARDAGLVPLCHVAFVDWQSERLIKHAQVADLAREDGEAFIGCWQLLRVQAGLPYTHGSANAFLAAAWLPRLFQSTAEFSYWVDASRQIRTTDAGALAMPLMQMAQDTMLVVSRSPTAASKATASAPADPSLLLRRHAPVDRALALAMAWWVQWEAAASDQSPPRPRSSRVHGRSSAIGGAAAADIEGTAAARIAAAALGAVCSEASWAAVIGAPSASWPDLAAAHAFRALLPTKRPLDDTWHATWPAAPINARRTVIPSRIRAPVADATPAVHYAKPANAVSGVSFGGGRSGGDLITAGERDAALALASSAHAALPCGFMAASVYDHAARVGATHAANCEIVTLTAVFDAFDELIQPVADVLNRASPSELACFYAFVDKRSHDLLLRENANRVVKLKPADAAGGSDETPAGDGVSHRIGVWNLILLDGPMPYASSRRNSRMPKMLAHRLFPKASYALWIDSKLRLHSPPSVIRKLFLPKGSGAVFAAYRNLKRDNIDEERDWIWRHKCADDVDNCPDLLEQWATYESEQASPSWAKETVAIEGSLLLQSIREPLHHALFCGWLNEYVRFGERDQMAISYVMHAMGLTRRGLNASVALRLIDRKYHYLTKPSLRPLTLVTKVGHRTGSRRLQK